MKRLAKIEVFALAIIFTVIRWYFISCGALWFLNETCYDCDCTSVLMVIITIITAYVEIRNCVFKCIEIVKR